MSFAEKPEPEKFFKRGLEALSVGKNAEARRLFESAMTMEQHLGVIRPQMRYRSYYGLSTCLADKPTPQMVKLCEDAANEDVFDSSLLLNLARVYLITGQTTKALTTLKTGLRREPGNRYLAALFKKIDRRSRPVLPLLGRDHPINRALGRIRTNRATARKT